MKILGIETSFDETAVAIVENGKKVLSSAIASSESIQQKYGGTVPEIAAREQVKYIIPVLDDTLKEADIAKPEIEIDAISVTTGPGLIGSLLVGVETAKTLAFVWKKSVIPVNHVHAHTYANFVQSNSRFKIQNLREKKSNHFQLSTFNFQLATAFPAISLVASGGHTELFLMKDEKTLKWLGGTRDDAAGEAFDKIAKMLGLPYPGGPALQHAAEDFRIQNSEFRIKLPRPIINDGSFNFSFSGLKTAVIRELQKHTSKLKNNQPLDHLTIQHFAYETQEAITDVLVSKAISAATKFQAKSILVSGGVAANARLREKFRYELRTMNYELNLFIPPPSLCTDNAAMIATCAYFQYKPAPWKSITAQPNLAVE